MARKYTTRLVKFEIIANRYTDRREKDVAKRIHRMPRREPPTPRAPPHKASQGSTPSNGSRPENCTSMPKTTNPSIPATHDAATQGAVARFPPLYARAAHAYTATRATITATRKSEDETPASKPPEARSVDDSNDMYPKARYSA